MASNTVNVTPLIFSVTQPFSFSVFMQERFYNLQPAVLIP